MKSLEGSQTSLDETLYEGLLGDTTPCQTVSLTASTR